MKEHALFIDIAKRYAQESHCLSWKVACLAVKEGRILCTGINGSLPGEENCDDHWNPGPIFAKTPRWREEHHVWSLAHEVHAEQNMIAMAAKLGISLDGCTIYNTTEPCQDCIKILLALHPKAIYFDEAYDKVDNSIHLDYMKRNGVIYEEI
jgi:dCMP deaminase